MKRITLIFCILLFIGCAKDPEYTYDDVSRIYFQYNRLNSKGNIVEFDSIVFSFGKHPIDVKEDTAKVVVQLLGTPSEYDKVYKVRVVDEGDIVSGKTNMVEGIHYAQIDNNQIFRAGKMTDTIRIVVFRDHLSPSIRNPESKSLILKLEENDDFKLGVKRGYEMKLSINNTLTAPSWWDKNTASLGFYHPKKWLLLIDLDPIFAIEDHFAGTGVDMHNKGLMLKDYLQKNILLDDETGKRITFEGLVDL